VASQDLRKLSRADLLELLLEERQENDRLREEWAQVSDKLFARTIEIETAASIADAALRLNGVFEAAEAAAAQYLENVRRLTQEQEL